MQNWDFCAKFRIFIDQVISENKFFVAKFHMVAAVADLFFDEFCTCHLGTTIQMTMLSMVLLVNTLKAKGSLN